MTDLHLRCTNMEETQSRQPTLRNGNGQAPSLLPSTGAIDGVEDRVKVEEEGVKLLQGFVVEQLEKNHIPVTDDIETAVASATVESKQEEPAENPQVESTEMSANGSPTPSLQKSKDFKSVKNGRGLDQIAHQIASSIERERVRTMARETVEDNEISAEKFRVLLSELFPQGEITRERIVVLFFFCSDVAIFAIKKKSFKFLHCFMVWALQYIRSPICTWVADNGGWEAVLFRSTNQYIFFGKIAVACVFACAIAYGAYKLGKAT